MISWSRVVIIWFTRFADIYFQMKNITLKSVNIKNYFWTPSPILSQRSKNGCVLTIEWAYATHIIIVG